MVDSLTMPESKSSEFFSLNDTSTDPDAVIRMEGESRIPIVIWFTHICKEKETFHLEMSGPLVNELLVLPAFMFEI